MQKIASSNKMDKWSFGEGNEVMVAISLSETDEHRYVSVVRSSGQLSSDLIQLCAIHCNIGYELTSYIDGDWVVVVQQTQIQPLLGTIYAVLQGQLSL